MQHIVRVLFFMLLLSTASLAQEKPDAPKPKHDRKVFFVGVSLLAASTTADGIDTRKLIDRGGWENDPLFGLWYAKIRSVLSSWTEQ